MPRFQIRVGFVFEHDFTEEEADEGTEVPPEVIRKSVLELLDANDYSVEEDDLGE